MSRLIGALLCACLVACGFTQAARAQSISAPPAAAAPFVYRGNGSDGVKGVAAFTTTNGFAPGGAVDFLAFDSLQSMKNDAGWSIPAWKGKVAQLAESVPLATKDVSLAQANAGAMDAAWTQAAQLLVAAGFPTAYVRLGWEFNGGWYPWAFKGQEGTYASVFRRAHDVMAAVPGAHFRFVWNPALYMQQQWPDWTWPGDAYVDVIATDAYCSSWAAGTTSGANVAVEPAMWSHVNGDQWGIAAVVAFAAKHGKPYAFPEWGTGERPDGHGCGDDDTFIRNMAPLVAKAEFSGIWDFPAGDYDGSFAHNPKAAAAFRAAFAPPPASPVATPAPIATLTAHVSTGTGTVAITPNADGSAWLALSFPTGGHHVVSLSETRPLGFSAKSIWFRSTRFDWDSAGTGKVYVGPK